MTILEGGYNDKWIIAKTGNGNKRTRAEYFKCCRIIKNDYEKIPDSETVKSNTTEFENRKTLLNF